MTNEMKELPWDKDVTAPIPVPAMEKSTTKRKVVVAVFAIALLWWLYLQGVIDLPHKAAYRGLSSGLRHSSVVPTLDTPLPPRRNVIWCASFQLSWNEARNHLFKAPIRLARAQAVAQRFNRAPSSLTDVTSDSLYTALGPCHKVVPTIRQEMARKFPDVSVADLPSPDANGLLLYAYMTASVPFPIPYHQNRATFRFSDSSGSARSVRSFGILPSDESDHYDLRRQVQVLYRDDDLKGKSGPPTEYALDLCRTSQPYQLVLAAVPAKATLADTVKYVQKKIAAMTTINERPIYLRHPDTLASNDVLIVPEMRWSITHHFTELEGNQIVNPGGGPLLQAVQRIDFQLNRNGVVLKSPSFMLMGSAPVQYRFDHPFLLYLTRRGSQTPCFVMWVENAELINT